MFEDRSDAGRLLAEKLRSYKGRGDVVICGLARGGVAVAYEIAKALALPLQALVPKKIGAPDNPELAIGAVAEDGETWLNHSLIQAMGIPPAWIEKAKREIRTLAQERSQLYRKKSGWRELARKVVILVDDGVATGATFLAEIQSLRKKGVAAIVAVSPVAASDAWQKIESLCDEAICLNVSDDLGGVSQFYRRFEQLEDQVVISLLQTRKRLFFAFEMVAPWPTEWPTKWPGGRLIEQRHTTLAFLRSVHYPSLEKILPQIPSPPFSFGPSGWYDALLYLPKTRPHVVAWRIHWLKQETAAFQKGLASWLKAHQFPVDRESWLPHTSICRDPEEMEPWRAQFHPLPCFAKAIRLYESLGHSQYRSIWTHALLPPFQEIDHTADIAFHVYGREMKDLYEHAALALAFKYPPLLRHWKTPKDLSSLEEVIIALNDLVGRADREIGVPFKAVSFHGRIEPYKSNLLQWEMIVDI